MAIYLEQKGDLLILDLWELGIDCVLEIRVMSTYAASYLHKIIEERLDVAERENKHKYLDYCI